MYDNIKQRNNNIGRYSFKQNLPNNEKNELEINEDALSYLKNSLNIPIDKL